MSLRKKINNQCFFLAGFSFMNMLEKNLKYFSHRVQLNPKFENFFNKKIQIFFLIYL